MRLFIRVAAGLALSALLVLLLLVAVLLVSPYAPPALALGLPLAGKVAALAASFVLLFLVVFFSPSFSRPASSRHAGLTQAPHQATTNDAQKRATSAPASQTSESCADAVPSADLIAQAVARTARQAVVSLVPESAKAASTALELSGRYVCLLSDGFEGLMPSGSGAISAASHSPVASRDGIFVIDADAISSMEGNAEIDRDFKSLVDSVLS